MTTIEADISDRKEVFMKYKCQICGYIYDEEKEGSPISMLEKCPLCQQPASNLMPLEKETIAVEQKEIISDNVKERTCSSDTALSEKMKQSSQHSRSRPPDMIRSL